MFLTVGFLAVDLSVFWSAIDITHDFSWSLNYTRY